MAIGFYNAAVQAICLLVCAPLIAGIVNKTKATLQKRQGASIFQEYFDLWKWWHKPVIVTKYTSWIFLAAPIVYLVTSIMAAMMLPGLLAGNIRLGDAFVFVYILALGRFFMTLGSLDSATAFGGMGGSREIYISVLVEPAVMLAILLNASRYGSTMLSQMVIDYNAFYFTVPAVMGGVAFFLVMLAENSRLPVDNPDTHLELTMIHECMTLEYSGRLLSYIHLGSMLKMLSFLVLFGSLYLPLPLPLVVKVLLSALLIGLVETLNNKMRLFKVRVYLAAAVIMLAVAIIAQ
ncbi:respiratory chain complex I subunit 1 family protein [Selenomonas ruminantium]|uniref:Formate hydrogenlyase subunit 4 n=1 Tax=Selenomonas ruminantium TaxID=971 RepID=A0A1H3VIX8_SELRU|nr:NADH-quinone oxidoreductase subunit H [Selenomonas ruminantium]SDZ74753.1 Formate hydrogenlyase subunit 4 [Selenomonas ruminantium]